MWGVNEIDILRARAMPSMPFKQQLPPRPVVKQPEVEREEGELCSSDDDQVSLSSLPMGGRGFPPNSSRVGGYAEVVAQEMMSTVEITGSSKVSKIIAPSSTANVSIVNKSQLLSGLSASAPSLGSMKSPIEVGTENSSVAFHVPGQSSLTAVDTARQLGSTVNISDREPTTSQGLVHASVKKLSAAAPVFKPTPNGSSAKLPLTHEKKSGRAGDVSKESNGTTSQAPHRPFSPPFAASHRPFSPPFAASHRPFSLVNRSSSSGARARIPVSSSADRTEADAFLAGLNLPGTTGSDPNLIINFSDTESEGEPLQTKPTQNQTRSGVVRVGAAGGKSIARTQTPPNANSDARRRAERTTGKINNKATVNTKAETTARSALVSKPAPPQTDAQIETLRLLIAAKENELQRNRVSQLPEVRTLAPTEALIQKVNTSGSRVDRTAGNKLAVNTASKIPFKKKSRLTNAAHMELGLRSVQANDAELVELGIRKASEAVLSAKSSDHQVSTGPSEGIAATQEAEVAVVRGKESGISSFGNIGEVRTTVPRGGSLVIPAITAAEPSRTVIPGGTAAAVSMGPSLSGIKVGEPGIRRSSSVLVNESGVPESGNVDAIQSAPEMTGAKKSAFVESAAVLPLEAPALPGRNGPASSSVIIGEWHLESREPEEAMGLSLKRRGSALHDSSEKQMDQQLNRRSNIRSQPCIGPDWHLGKSASGVVTNRVGVPADGDNLSSKRQRTDEHSLHARVTEHAAANLPLQERRLDPQLCPPGLSPTSQKCRGESRSSDLKDVPFLALNSLVCDQQYSHSQKHKTLDVDISSGTVDLPSLNTLKVSSDLRVQPSSPVYFSKSQVRDSQLIRNRGKTPWSIEPAPLSIEPASQEAMAKVDGGGLSRGLLQPLHHLPNPNFVTTDSAGVQIRNSDNMMMVPPAFTSSHVLQSEVPHNLFLQNNRESAPTFGDPGGCSILSSLQHYEAGGSHLGQLRMQDIVAEGSASFSLEKLQEEEDIVDKELEEAQINRRHCEIRERELRRAFREAQNALCSADARCKALSERRKLLNYQVQTAEVHIPQQPPFSIHGNSLVPYDKSVAPMITEPRSPAYPSIVRGSVKPSTGQESVLRRGFYGNAVSSEKEARIQSTALVDKQTSKRSLSSADREILEENLGRRLLRGTQLLGGHIPNTQEVAVGDQSTLSDKDDNPDFTFRAEGEVSASTNSGSAAPAQKLKGQRHTGTIMPSDAACHGVLRSKNPADLQDSSQEDHDLQNRPMAIHDNDTSVSGSKGGCHTQFTSTSSGHVQAHRADTEVEKELLDVQELLSPSLKSDRGLLRQGDLAAAISLDISEQETVEDGREKIRSTSFAIQKPTTTGKENYDLSKTPRQDLSMPNALGSGTEDALANVAVQAIGMVDFDGKIVLLADSRSNDILNNRIMVSKQSGQNEDCREHLSEIPTDTRVIIIPKKKREISGLRALAENVDMEPVDGGCEEISKNNGQAIRSSSLEVLTAERRTWESNISVEQQSCGIVQVKASEVTADKGDCASRTSVSSEGETGSLQGEEGREEGREEVIRNGIGEMCLEVPRSANSAENRSGVLAYQGDLAVDIGVLHGIKDVVQDDQPLDLESRQLPSTVFSVGFADLETASVPALCLAYNQVARDKISDESTFRLDTYESPLTMFRSYRICSEFQAAWHKSVKSQTWSHKLDPCKPLCRFEYRGKCNDDACPWQHVADYTLNEVQLLSQLSKYLNLEHVFDAHLSSEEVSALIEEFSSGTLKSIGSIISQKSLLPRTFIWNRGSQAPLYKIGLYPVNQEEGFTFRVKCCLRNQCKFNPFTSLTLSSAIRRPIHSDMPCLPANFWYVDSQITTSDASGWRYTGDRSLAAIEEHVVKEPGDIEAWLELALVRIDFDLNCTDIDAYNEALYVLSRALEANPTVATLWVVYIGLFYQGKGEIGDDDLFFHAIENSKGSYELLCLYINSRTTLLERLKAYDMALQALVNDGDQSQDQSACILDVVIQMLDCICCAKDTQLLRTWSEGVADGSSTGITASIRACLTPEDCCILMVAFAYAVAFGELPHDFLLRLGCKQRLPWDLGWCRRLQVQEGSKDLVLKIMETGIHCASVLSREESEQVMIVNYLKCLALYHGSEHALQLGWKIMERLPTCVELILFVVRLEREQGWTDVFMHALQQFPKEATGQQRLWYQYAVHMLQAVGSVGAMHILHECATAACQGISDGEKLIASNEVDATREGLWLNARRLEKAGGSCNLNGREAVFAWMNLALFEMLSGNKANAQLALEKSMKAAVEREDVMHCWKEMAAFVRFNKTGQEQASAISDLLDRCCVATTLHCKFTPLASRLLSPISKRRARTFLESLMESTSVDYTLINSVVEVIINKEPSVTKEVAVIVEALMEIFPGNHELVLQVYRMLIDNLDSFTDMAAAMWISSLLFGSLLQASPQAREQNWVEAGQLLEQLQDEISLRSFYQFALVLYPFSANLKESVALFDNTIKADVS